MAKLKKVRVRLKDITIRDEPHIAAEWRVKGKHQCWLGREELAKIVHFHEKGLAYKKRLFYKI